MIESKAKTRIVLLLSIFSVVGQIPGLLYLSGPEPYPYYAHRFDYAMYGISLWLSFLVAPVCAIFAFIIRRRALRNTHMTKLSTPGADTQRFIVLAAGGGMALACFVVALYIGSTFTSYEYRDADPRGTIDAYLDNIAAVAYQYRIRPRSMQGGGDSYKGFSLPRRMESDTGWWGRIYTYRIVWLSADSIRLEGRCDGEVAGAVRATLEGDGKLTNRRYYGEFDW